MCTINHLNADLTELSSEVQNMGILDMSTKTNISTTDFIAPKNGMLSFSLNTYDIGKLLINNNQLTASTGDKGAILSHDIPVASGTSIKLSAKLYYGSGSFVVFHEFI
jgi:hypothetical protein